MEITDQRIKAMTTSGLNLIGQALSIYDHQLRLVLCNTRFQEMFDLPENLTEPGARFYDTIHFLASRGEYGNVESVDEMVDQRVQQALAFEPHYIERTRPNGQVISVEGAPLPTGGWVAVYTDITRTKQAEGLLRARSEELSEQLLGRAEELSATNRKLASTITALEEAKRQLTEIEARTRMTTEMMPAHIAHLGADGRYDYSNRRLSSVMPGRPSDILGLHISEALGADAFEKVKANLDKAYGGETSVFEFTEAQDSRRIRVSFTPDGEGGLYIMSVDITEETQARVALQQTRRRAMAAQMTSGLAHDFSNLLTIILGMQSRLDKMNLPAAAHELVEATQQTVRRGGQLLNRIADMTGSRTPQPRPTDMRGLLEDLRILATPSLPRGVGLSVVNTLPDTALMLDPGMVQDALLNLVLNARDACGLSGQITISAHAVGAIWVEITVSDTGTGFSDKAMKNALNPFFTTKGSKGSGLGLPMVYDTVKLAGGDLRLRNTPSGASVVLRLPYRPVPPVSTGLVLLVEDQDELRLHFRDMLVDLGCTVIEATTAKEALTLLADVEDIALVLSDIRLEGDETGVDLANQLQGKFPCILMTSLSASEPLYRQAVSTAPVLDKPFTKAQLAALIQSEVA